MKHVRAIIFMHQPLFVSVAAIVSLPLACCAQTLEVSLPQGQSRTAPIQIATIPRKPAPAIAAPRAMVMDYDYQNQGR